MSKGIEGLFYILIWLISGVVSTIFQMYELGFLILFSLLFWMWFLKPTLENQQELSKKAEVVE